MFLRARMIRNLDRILLSTYSVPRCASLWYSRMIMSDTWWLPGNIFGVSIPWNSVACFSLPPTTIKPSRITRQILAIGLDFETDSLRHIDNSFAYCSFCTSLSIRFSALIISAILKGLTLSHCLRNSANTMLSSTGKSSHSVNTANWWDVLPQTRMTGHMLLVPVQKKISLLQADCRECRDQHDILTAIHSLLNINKNWGPRN